MITNNNDISLEMAVWLLHDEYDYVDMPNYISATTLMKPLRHILLPHRIPEEQQIVPDVADKIPSALGNALHAAIEKAWMQGHRKALQQLGYPKGVIDRVLINPTPEVLARVENPIPVYIEQRAFKQIDGFTVGGKFDMVAEGMVRDVKSTTTYNWTKESKDDDYRLQGSIYRWLNPEKITEDKIRINFIFTDWQKFRTSDPTYPQRRVVHKDIELMSLEETEAWIRNKLTLIQKHRGTPEKDLPECTDEELWISEPKFKYYANPLKTTGKSTRNFDTLLEANKFKADKGGKGVVLTVKGEAKRCAYCPAFPICTQKDKFND